MKLAVAQIRSAPGAISTNLTHHLRWVDLARQMGATAIAFPELSLTGYEPSLAADLALSPTDDRLAPLQQMADRDRLSIGVGLPTRHDAGICISQVFFHPHTAPQVYSKQYLHADETPFFMAGHPTTGVMATAPEVAIAICYELSVSAHVERAAQQGANIYLASVAKSADGVQRASKRLRAIAQQYAMRVVMVNCIGPCDDFVGAGGSAMWDAKGHRLAQLDATHEGLLLWDTETDQVIAPAIAAPDLPVMTMTNEI